MHSSNVMMLPFNHKEDGDDDREDDGDDKEEEVTQQMGCDVDQFETGQPNPNPPQFSSCCRLQGDDGQLMNNVIIIVNNVNKMDNFDETNYQKSICRSD